jgi:dihydrofolate reductase
MKKISALIAILFAAVALCAVTVNPSLDGRAVVADRGVFPSGNYGKAPGYLPGDTVIVTNHSTGFQLEVMILSTSDASEGIAILLSPEAAEKLNIVRGKDVYVKIQKKQAIPFEKVLTSSDTETGKDIAGDPDKNPSKILEDSPELLQFLKDSKTASENESPKVIEIVPEENTETPQETPVEEIAAESNDEAENADSVEAESPVLAEAIVTEDTNELIPEDIIAISEDEIPVLEETQPLPPESDDVLIETAAEEHPEIIAEVIEADEEVPVIAAEEGTEIVQEDLPVNSETAIIDPVLVEEDQESIIE